jgi:hypothetical protein
VRYYQVVAETKLLVMRHAPRRTRRYVELEGGGADIGNGLIYEILHRRLWFEAIAAFLQLELEPVAVAPAVDDDERDWLYEALLHQLRDVVVPRITESLAHQRAKGFARIIKHLREVHLHGAYYEDREIDDLATLVGHRPTSVREGRVALARAAREGIVSETDYLQALWRQTARDNELLRTASGALADRHWPALR